MKISTRTATTTSINESNITAINVPWTEQDFAHPPTSTNRITNDFEDTLSFTTADNYSVDVCTVHDNPGELTIAVSDEVGNLVTGIVISPALLQNFLNSLTQNTRKAS